MTVTAAQNKGVSKTSVLLITSAVSSLIMLDSNIVAVSLPAIGQTLKASFTDIEWVVSAYLLAYAALLLATGNFADLNGRKKAMLIGLCIFGIASAGCGLAPSSMILNIARAVQGFGGAMLLTSALAIITSTFTGQERAHAFAVWGAALGIALTAGPILGGLITHAFGWRWVFLVNVPLCLILIGATAYVIEESRDEQAKRLDFIGIVTFTPGLFLLIWALIDGNGVGWSSVSILARLVGAACFFVTFVFVELRQERPMVDFGLFKRRTFRGAVIAMLGYGATAQVMVFYLPLFLENAYGFEPLKAGLAMIPFAVPMVMAPRVTTKFAVNISGRNLLTTGLMITVIANLLFWWTAKAGLAYPYFVVSMVVAGVGAGLLNGETVRVLGAAVPPERAGMASGLASTTRFIGILVGVAGLGAILSDVARSAFLASSGVLNLDSETISFAVKHMISGDLAQVLGNMSPSMRMNVLDVARSSYSQGFSSASILSIITAGIACFLTFRLVDSEETKASSPSAAPEMKKDCPCKFIDCRHPM